MAIRVVVAVFCFHLLVDGSISAPNSATAVGRPKRDTSERYASSKLVGCIWCGQDLAFAKLIKSMLVSVVC